MPPEVADSDAESDLESPIKLSPMSGLGNEDAHPPHASPSVIDFDQFLDPTQRLSSSASHHVSSVDQIDGAADTNISPETIGGIATTQSTSLFSEMLSAVKSKKRAHSALQDGSKDLSHDNSDKKSKAKRSKTYGTASRSCITQEDDLFAPHLALSSELKDSESIDPDATTRDQAASGLPLSSADPAIPVTTSSSGRTGVISLLGQSLAEATPLMTTSMASMGQYQSINLDFRGSAQGLDLNANPFGSLSQVSLEGSPNQAGLELLANVLGASKDQSLHNDANPLIYPTNGLSEDKPLPAMSQSPPERPLAINPAQLMQSDGAALDTDADYHPQGRPTTAEVVEPAADTVLPSMEKPPPPKKRGRKPKNPRLSSKSPGPSLTEDADELALPSLPQANRSRRGTVDSLSQASELSATNPSTRKRKRGKSKQFVVEETRVKPPDSSPVKQPTSELNLSDEATIGLPKEAYKPRPSRSRSKVIAEEETLSKSDETSPMKPPSSQINLSDEAAVGLPKEAYKPRPSRSRSKKVVDEELPALPPPEPEFSQRTPARDTRNNVPEEEAPSINPTKSSTKKGRKSKVKRAKTSAAALLKRTDPMLSEGEEDVVWMDSKPAPVRLDLPPDLKALKKEPDPPEDNEKDDWDARKPTTGKSSNITIEIPTNAEAKDPVAEPKKRGRKPKNVQQKSEEKITEEEEDQPQEEGTASRPVLAEKSTNVCATADKNSTGKDPKKTPTVSPLTSPEPEPKPQPKPNKLTDKDKESRPLTTPAKPKSSAPPSLVEKGPTKHSPINPPSLSNSGRKALYRVGLSRRQNIPSLLRKVDRDKPPPKNVVRKEKESKKKKDQNYDEEGGNDPSEMRGADGMLIEWEF